MKPVPLLYAVFFLTATAGFFFAGGGLVLLFKDQLPVEASPVSLSIAIASASTLIAAATAAQLWRQDRKAFLFSTILFFAMSIVTLYASELLASLFLPSWPAIGLHGVEPELGAKAWGRVTTFVGSATGFNSWGQRDLERSLEPLPGIRRISFIGDSYLEESSTVPVNIATERRINEQYGDGRRLVEVINLGVSATAPDEYYYRAKHIALPLGTQLCVLFLCAANDLTCGRTLSSDFGIAAVYPRDSVLNSLGARSLNHVFTNHQRPVLRAWGHAGELGRKEQALADGFRREEQPRDLLLSVMADPERGHQPGAVTRDRLAAYLATRDLTGFYRMLANPDQGLFRSHYLRLALHHVAGTRKSELDADCAYSYVLRTRAACRGRNASFVLVLIPDAFAVDTRMQQAWSALVDMRAVIKPRTEAARRLLERAQRDGITAVDLTLALNNTEGTYLNPDGHWSQKGVEIVAGALAQALVGK